MPPMVFVLLAYAKQTRKTERAKLRITGVKQASKGQGLNLKQKALCWKGGTELLRWNSKLKIIKIKNSLLY